MFSCWTDIVYPKTPRGLILGSLEDPGDAGTSKKKNLYYKLSKLA